MTQMLESAWITGLKLYILIFKKIIVDVYAGRVIWWLHMAATNCGTGGGTTTGGANFKRKNDVRIGFVAIKFIYGNPFFSFLLSSQHNIRSWNYRFSAFILGSINTQHHFENITKF